MASMTIYRPECEHANCSGRATFQITSARYVVSLYCGAHAKTALFNLTKAEGALDVIDATPIESGKAVRA